jgi:hypothetical protein
MDKNSYNLVSYNLQFKELMLNPLIYRQTGQLSVG